MREGTWEILVPLVMTLAALGLIIAVAVTR
jgi:hypothetical protein